MEKANNKKLIGIISGVVAGVVAIALVLFFVLGNKEQVVTYKLNQSGTESTLTYYAKGDRVYKQTAKNVIPYSAYGFKNAEEAKALFDDALKKVDGIEGYSDTIEYTENSIIETVEVNYDIVDLEKVKEVPGVYLGDTSAKGGVSLSKSVEYLEKNGYTKAE